MMKRDFLSFGLLALLVFLGGCSEVELISHVAKTTMPPVRGQGTFKVGNPYKVEGRTYYPAETYDYEETGIASWYGNEFKGKRTANGEIFDPNELTAAHRTLQMPSLVRVTNLDNGRSLIVRVNDRGPYSAGA
jgi:rare lipoprotein A